MKQPRWKLKDKVFTPDREIGVITSIVTYMDYHGDLVRTNYIVSRTLWARDPLFDVLKPCEVTQTYSEDQLRPLPNTPEATLT